MKVDQIRKLIDQAVKATKTCNERLEEMLDRISSRAEEQGEQDAGVAAIFESKDYCAGPIGELKAHSESPPESEDYEAAKKYVWQIADLARAVVRAVGDIYTPDKSMFFRLYQPEQPDLHSDEYYAVFQPLFADILAEADSLIAQLEDLKYELAESIDVEEAIQEADIKDWLSDQIEPCRLADDSVGKSAFRARANKRGFGRADEILITALGANPNPQHLKSDVVALAEHRERLLRSNFKIVKEKKAGRVVTKVEPTNSRQIGVETQTYGAASVTYQYFYHCLTEVTKSIEWLEAEICECDEDLIRILRTRTIVCMETLVEEVRRPGGPIRDKVEYQATELVELIGAGHYGEGELIEMLGIDVRGKGIGGPHRIELSYAMHERNVQAVLMIRRYAENLVASLYELIDDCSLPWELPQLLGTTSDLVAELKADLVDAGFSRSDNSSLEVIDWMDDAFASGVFSLQSVSDLHVRQLIEIQQTSEKWLVMIEDCIDDESILSQAQLKRSFKQLRRYVQKTEMVTKFPVDRPHLAEAHEEKLA